MIAHPRWNDRARARLLRVWAAMGVPLEAFAEWLGAPIGTLNCWGSRNKNRVPGWVVEKCIDWEETQRAKGKK